MWSSTYAVARKSREYDIIKERPRYDEGYTYCNNCYRNMPKDSLRCLICNLLVRRLPVRRKKLELKRY